MSDLEASRARWVLLLHPALPAAAFSLSAGSTVQSNMMCMGHKPVCMGVATRRRGSSKETRGTAYVVYDDIYDAKTACDHLSGFNVANRYLIVIYVSAACMLLGDLI